MPADSHRRFAVWFVFLALAAAAFAGKKPEAWIGGMYAGNSPAPVAVPEDETWQRATEVADHTPGAFVLLGTGRSMLPLYSPGTVLVIVPRPFNALRPGQTVLYRNKDNRLIAHLLLSHTRDGWRVRGLNNRWQDMEPVVEENLSGVVVAAFRPIPSASPRLVASAIAQPTTFFAEPR